MAFEPIEAARSGLVTVSSFGIDGRDDPVGSYTPKDPEDFIVALLDVLSGDGG